MGDRSDRGGNSVSSIALCASEDVPTWIKVIGAVGPFVVASIVMAVGIAQFSWNKHQTARQLELGRQKVRLDLFDRRNAIYQRFREVQGALNRNSRSPDVITMDAAQIYLDSVFLFQKPVIDFLFDFKELTWKLQSTESIVESTDVFRNADQLDKQLSKRTALRRELNASYEKADNVFRSAIAIDFD